MIVKNDKIELREKIVIAKQILELLERMEEENEGSDLY